MTTGSLLIARWGRLPQVFLDPWEPAPAGDVLRIRGPAYPAPFFDIFCKPTTKMILQIDRSPLHG